MRRQNAEMPATEGIVADADETMGELNLVVAASPFKTSEEAEENKNTPNNPSAVDAVQQVLHEADLIRLIGFFIQGHLHSFCFTSKFHQSTLGNTAYLEMLMAPYKPSTPKDFGMFSFQFLNFYSKGSFTRLDDYATESHMFCMRISDNGAFVYFDNDDFQNSLHTKWNVATKQTTLLKNAENIVAMTANGKTFLGNAYIQKEDEFISQAACWNCDNEDATLLPLEEAVDISPDGQSIIGYSLETEEQASEPVICVNGIITPLLPLEGITYFTLHGFLKDGAILGWDGPTFGIKKQAVVLRNGIVEKLPKGFEWGSEKYKGNQLIGRYNDEFCEYAEGEVKPLPNPFFHIASFNNGPVVWGSNDFLDAYACCICDRVYFMDDLTTELGIKLEDDETLIVMDTTQNNRTVIGVIQNLRTSMNTPFIANLPPYWFNKQ